MTYSDRFLFLFLIYLYCCTFTILQKKRGVIMSNNNIVGKKVGTISIHMYNELETNAPLFFLESENQDVLPVSYVVEDFLKKY